MDLEAAHYTVNLVPHNKMYLNTVFGLVWACRSSPWLETVKIETVSLFSCSPVCSFGISVFYVLSQLRETFSLRSKMFIHNKCVMCKMINVKLALVGKLPMFVFDENVRGTPALII